MNDKRTDETEIRRVIDTWLAASKAGDVDTVLSLMADDVVFLVAGRPPMRKADFAAASRAETGPGAPQIDGRSEIQDLQVMGDCAVAWTRLTVVITPRDGGAGACSTAAAVRLRRCLPTSRNRYAIATS